MRKIVIFTKKGKVIKFEENNIPSQIRGGLGVKAIILKDDDEIASVITYNDK